MTWRNRSIDYPRRIPARVLARARELGWLGEFVRAGGRWLHYVSAGESAAATDPAVILLHGFGVWGFNWRFNLGPLAVRHRVLVPDLPGWGLSEKGARVDYSFRAQIDAVAAFMDAVGVSTATLVGNSMGGEVAWRFALRRPERVERLVLIGSSAYIDTLPPIARRLAVLPGAAWFVRLLIGNRRFMLRAMREAYYAPGGLVTPDALDGYLLPLRTPAAAHALIATLGSIDFGADTSRIREVRHPTLVVWGEDDPWIPLFHGLRLAAEIPGARLEVLPRTGHSPQEEHPDEVNRLIEDFVAASRQEKPYRS